MLMTERRRDLQIRRGHPGFQGAQSCYPFLCLSLNPPNISLPTPARHQALGRNCKEREGEEETEVTSQTSTLLASNHSGGQEETSVSL